MEDKKQIEIKHGGEAMLDLLNQEQAELQKAMIEEIQQCLANASCKGFECENCTIENNSMCVCVRAMYNLIKKKLPEDSVVLTKVKYAEMKFKIVELEGKLLENKAVRNETAREILQWLIEHTFESCIFETYFRERFGVEVE